MAEYLVLWVASVEAEDAQEAAERARDQQAARWLAGDVLPGGDQFFVKAMEETEHHFEYRYEDMEEVFA